MESDDNNNQFTFETQQIELQFFKSFLVYVRERVNILSLNVFGLLPLGSPILIPLPIIGYKC